jgi:hypothetical protein
VIGLDPECESHVQAAQDIAGYIAERSAQLIGARRPER